jgi:hypothetical protein
LLKLGAIPDCINLQKVLSQLLLNRNAVGGNLSLSLYLLPFNLDLLLGILICRTSHNPLLPNELSTLFTIRLLDGLELFILDANFLVSVAAS